MKTEEKNQCPVDCPFLVLRSFLPNTMPYYCTKYEKFLGVSVAQKVQRCPFCLGHTVEMIPYALSLLETQSHSNELKQAFLKMLPQDQKKLVDLLSQNGVQLSFNSKILITPLSLSSLVHQLLVKYAKYEKSPERQSFLKLLKLISDAGTPIDGNTSSLLANLFEVIDASEKGMLLAIMENPARLRAFLKQLSKIPKDQNMLKNFRALLYDYDRQRQQEQNTPVSLNHLIRGLTKIQMVKKKQKLRD